MLTINCINVNDGLIHGYRFIKEFGVESTSRNGPVYVMPFPVTICYGRPEERVLFSKHRDANPFFHLMESLWMLAGRNDVDWIGQFNSTFAQFSDNGVTFHGAYGKRWRGHFNSPIMIENNVEIGHIDQIETIINLLEENPQDRRIVLQMWDPVSDLGIIGKDFPCNLCITFRYLERLNELDIHVFNRSNDMIWGAFGANAVHMSMLQEFVARALGMNIGKYYQISTNFHAYRNTFEKHIKCADEQINGDHYTCNPDFKPYPIMSIPYKEWLGELAIFIDDGPIIGFKEPFFKHVVFPIYNAWFAFKDRDYNYALKCLEDCQADDWAIACHDWIDRRIPK
jgi:thymidylate synthase